MDNKQHDQFFEELEHNKPLIKEAQRHLTDVLNASLSCGDYDSLRSLIPYIEEGKGSILLQYVGESHRILRILQVIDLECKYQMTPFSSDCYDKDSLMEKYMLSLFAIRRLLFQLSPSSVEEAVYFLQHNVLSAIAVYIILQNELLVPNQALYDQILDIYSDYWPREYKQLWFSLLNYKQEQPQ